MMPAQEPKSADDDATNNGQSAPDPAEGSDDAPAGGEGSPGA